MSAILRGIGLNLISRASVVIGGGGALVLLARTFGPEEFGSWSTAVVWASLVATISEGGIANTLLHRAAHDPEKISSHIGALLKARLGFGLLALTVALGLWLWVEGTTWVALLLLLGGGRILDGIGSTLSFALYTVDEFKTQALLEVVRRFGFLLVLVAISQMGGTLFIPALFQFALGLFVIAMLLVIVRRRLGIDLKGQIALGRTTLWFWLTGIFVWANAEMDLMMLGILTTASTTGTYAAAMRLVLMLSLVSSAVSHAVIARFFRRGAERDEERTDTLLEVTALAVTSLGAVVGVEFIFSGSQIVGLLYGPGYEEGGRILSLLGVFVIFDFARQAPSWYVAAGGGEKFAAILLGMAAMVNLSANLVLIPRLAGTGAALASVASGSLVLLGMLWAASRRSSSRVIRATVMGFAPGVLLVLAHVSLPSRAPWFLPSLVFAAGAGCLVAWIVVSPTRTRRLYERLHQHVASS